MKKPEKDVSIPTPDDLLKIHNAAKLKLKRKQESLKRGGGNIFKVSVRICRERSTYWF